MLGGEEVGLEVGGDGGEACVGWVGLGWGVRRWGEEVGEGEMRCVCEWCLDVPLPGNMKEFVPWLEI